MKDTMDTQNPKQIVESGYDRVAEEYARLEGETQWPRMRWIKKLLKLLKPSSRILDIGCGSGDPADIEISKFHNVTGIDISQVQISLARKNVPGGFFLHGDVGSVEFPSVSFDAAISFYTLEHIPRNDHETILRRIYQWLRPPGYILVSLEAGDYDNVTDKWLGVPMFISCYDPQTMKDLVKKAGFDILETAIEIQVEQNHDVPYLWILARKKAKQE